MVTDYTYVKDGGIPEPTNNLIQLCRSDSILGQGYSTSELEKNGGDYHRRGAYSRTHGIIEYDGVNRKIDDLFGINMDKTLINEAGLDINLRVSLTIYILNLQSDHLTILIKMNIED